MKKNKISKLLVILLLISIIIPVKGFALENSNLYKDDYFDYYSHEDYGEYDEPDDWSYREDWKDEWDKNKDEVKEIPGFVYSAAAFVIIIVVIIFTITFVVELVEIIGFWKIFKKAQKQLQG